jgi:hypothetical protein
MSNHKVQMPLTFSPYLGKGSGEAGGVEDLRSCGYDNSGNEHDVGWR